MDDLIKALQIFRKYSDTRHPTHCEHDIMHINVEVDLVSSEDVEELDKLGFSPDEFGTFKSYRFGSC